MVSLKTKSEKLSVWRTSTIQRIYNLTILSLNWCFFLSSFSHSTATCCAVWLETFDIKIDLSFLNRADDSTGENESWRCQIETEEKKSIFSSFYFITQKHSKLGAFKSSIKIIFVSLMSELLPLARLCVESITTILYSTHHSSGWDSWRHAGVSLENIKVLRFTTIVCWSFTLVG